MRTKILILSCIAIVAYTFWPNRDSSHPEDVDTSAELQQPTSKGTIAIQPVEQQKAATSQSTIKLTPTAKPKVPSSLETKPGSAAAAGVYPADIGQSSFSNDEFHKIVRLLRTDPEFLLGLQSEFQTSQNPARLKRLAFMLGDLRDDSLVNVATQMLNSGQSISEIAALQLLGRLQIHSTEAREQILQVINVRPEASVVIGALNALARPMEENVVESERLHVANQITPLLSHPDNEIRRHSYALLFRWADTVADLEPTLLSALEDSDPGVRRTAAQGFIKAPNKTQAAKLALLRMLDNQEESAGNRKAAALALQNFDLAPEEKAQVDKIASLAS